MIVYETSAFTRNNKGGNLAGVIILDNVISENDMQRIATELNYSETAFIEILNDNHFSIRYFTINQEVGLCGHATIASFYVLNKLKYLSENKAILHTKAGLVNVEINDNIFIKMPSASIKESISKEVVAILLNINKEEIINIPRIVEVGLADCMVILNNLDTLNRVRINKEAMIKVSNDYNITGFHVTTIENAKYYVRNFGPACGIDEESATGTANASMYIYLERKGYINGNEEISFLQGDNMHLESTIIVKKNEGSLYVGGQANIIKEFEVE